MMRHKESSRKGLVGKEEPYELQCSLQILKHLCDFPLHDVDLRLQSLQWSKIRSAQHWGRRGAHLSENKGVKSECKKFGENSRQMATVSTICDKYRSPPKLKRTHYVWKKSKKKLREKASHISCYLLFKKCKKLWWLSCYAQVTCGKSRIFLLLLLIVAKGKKNAQFNSDSRLLLCLKAWVRGIPQVSWTCSMVSFIG